MKKILNTGFILFWVCFLAAGAFALNTEETDIQQDPGALVGDTESDPIQPEYRQVYPNRLVLTNEYIAVAVNTSPDGTGRIGMKVTGGDPYREADEDQPLIYGLDRKSTRLNSSHVRISYAVFCLKKKKNKKKNTNHT